MALTDAGTQLGMLHDLPLQVFAQRFANCGFCKAQMRDVKPQHYDNEDKAYG